ncbi:uncharacterized protein LOC130672354 isoform X1 [Microplitis mediator]|uniref:uncharacterized protein LOC130672354 isoform X1 n=1 Tax=Microplitis mediator TaxID=375433 RepID=UPI002554AD24|nr:uncharacterized protein LOC130672354 isoform X1 [Microplitis mediator]
MKNITFEIHSNEQEILVLNKSITILRYCRTLSCGTKMHKKLYNQFIRIFNYSIYFFYCATVIADFMINNNNDLAVAVEDECVAVGWIITISKIHNFYLRRHKIIEIINDVQSPLGAFRESYEIGFELILKKYMLFATFDCYQLIIIFLIFIVSVITISICKQELPIIYIL